MDEPNKWYISSDLSLINYFLTSTKSELWNPGASSRAIKFINELNVLTEGTNISYYLDVRAGNQDKDMLYESAFGPVTVFYNGYAYGTRETGIYLQYVIYIPKSTKDTKEAYIEAAQKRINDYLGKDNGVLVTYGGLISSLPEFAEDIDNPINSDGNYYNISILGKTYKFYIVKVDDSKLVVPKYNAKNLTRYLEEKKEISIVPFNLLYFEAAEEAGVTDLFLRLKNIKDKTDENYIFMNEVLKLMNKIIKRLQELQLKMR